MSNEDNPQTSKQVTISDNDFSSQIKNGYVFVDFWAEWCPPCKMVAPVLDKIAEKWEGKIKFAKVDVDANPETQAKYGVMSLPTFILFHNGEPIAQTVGAAPETAFEKFLAANYKTDDAA